MLRYPNKYYPSTGASSFVDRDKDKNSFSTNRRPVRPTRPARPPRPNQIVTYFPGGSTDPTPASGYAINGGSSIRNTTSKHTFPTTPGFTQKTASTIFPIIIRRTTKTPPTRRTTTPLTTPKPSTYSLPIFHTIAPPRELSTTTASTPRPVSLPPLSASSRGGACGEPQIKQFCPKGRIVNGTQSCYGQFPWQVVPSIYLKTLSRVKLRHSNIFIS